MRPIKSAIALTVILAALSGCSGKEAQAPAPAAEAVKPPVAVEVATLAPTTVEEGVDVVGSLSPKFESFVRAEVKTRVTRVNVTQWVNVAKDQPLAESDVRDLVLNLERAKAGIAAAKSQVDGARSQEASAKSQASAVLGQEAVAKSQEEAAKAGLLGAEVDRDRAEREYQRVLKLKEAGLATQQAVDEGKTARDAASARIDAAKAQIASARAQAEAVREQANAAKAQIEAATAQIASAQAQVKALEEEARQIEVLIGKAVIRSPINGTVAERTVNVGDLPGDSVLFHLVDNNLLNLTVSVPSQQFGGVKVGQELVFTTDAVPGESFTGQVMFINPAADPSDRSVRVVAEVKNVPQKLKGGFFAKGRIVTGQRANVLTAPKKAFVSLDVAGKKGEVYVLAGQKAKKVTVAIGAMQGDSVEVAGGLNPGDKVITRGAFALRDGDAVKIEGEK